MINAVIFDLDGTLLYTIEDLTDGVNYAMESFHYPKYSIEEVRKMVGNGIKSLIKRAIPAGEDNPDFSNVFEAFRSYYTEHCMDKTRPYPKIMELLEELRNRGIKTAIVSNKNDQAVKQLKEHFFSKTVSYALGQSDNIKNKPAPDMVFQAMKALDVTTDQVVYVGDSEVDYETAHNAGIKALIVSWGFRDRAELEKLPGVHIVDRPEVIIDVLNCEDGK